MKRTRVLDFVWLGLTVAVMVVLPGSLAQLELHPGQPFSLERADQTGLSSDLTFAGEPLFLVVRGMLGLAVALLPLYIIVSLITAKGRRRLLGDVVALLIWLGLIWLLRLSAQPDVDRGNLLTSALAPFDQASSSAPIAKFAANTPQWLNWLASLAIALLILALAVGGIWIIKRRGRGEPSSRIMSELAQRAEDAIQALQDGGDLSDTVIRCYVQMSQLLYRERGIQRAAAMTAREFELALLARGLPAQPVCVLTRLFEQVRYGNERPTKHQEQQAIDSLSAIAALGRSGT